MSISLKKDQLEIKINFVAKQWHSKSKCKANSDPCSGLPHERS